MNIGRVPIQSRHNVSLNQAVALSRHFQPAFGNQTEALTEARKERREHFYQEMKSFSAEAQLALREIFNLATSAPNDLGFHAYYARILGGKYPEIRPLLLQEAIGLEMMARGTEDEAENARQTRKDFQMAARKLAMEPAPIEPHYVPVKQIAKPEAKKYYDAYNAATEKEFNAFIQKYPLIRRRR